MSWNLPFIGSGFPPSVQPSLPASIVVDEKDLYWSAITVGRPNRMAVLAHGSYSVAELLWRISLLDANVMKLPTLTGLYNSPAFDALDGTEKGLIDFVLGMLLTKLCADKLLGMPWLFHFKWFRTVHPVSTMPGGSIPDFIGLDPTGPHYHSLEAKGRNSGYSASVLDGAKAQALQAININGHACQMHIGALLYRLPAGRLAMAMKDPELDGPPWQMEEEQQTWSEYYRVVWGLANLPEQQKRGLRELLGIKVELDPEARSFIEGLMTPVNPAWREARDGLVQWSANLKEIGSTIADHGEARTFRDGIKVGYEPPEVDLRRTGL